MLVARDGTHQQDVGLGVAVLAVEDALGFFLEFIAQSFGGRQTETVGQHHNRTHIQARGCAIASDLLHRGVVGDLHFSLEDRVREHGLGHFHPGYLLGQVTVGANNLAGGLPRVGVVLLGPERIGPTRASTAKQQAQTKAEAQEPIGKTRPPEEGS